MADTVQEATEICRNLEFELKLKIMMASVAKEVLAESRMAKFHLSRVKWANRALNRPAEEVKKVCLIVSLVSEVELTATDEVVLQAIRDDVDTFAGAFNEAPQSADGDITSVVIEETDHDNNPNTPPVVTKRSIFSFLKRQR